jgi:hypothetical protein
MCILSKVCLRYNTGATVHDVELKKQRTMALDGRIISDVSNPANLLKNSDKLALG